MNRIAFSSTNIKNILEIEFQKANKSIYFENENHLRDKLVEFLKLNLPLNVNVKKEVITSFGIIDILINNEYVIELKYADNIEH